MFLLYIGRHYSYQGSLCQDFRSNLRQEDNIKIQHYLLLVLSVSDNGREQRYGKWP